MNEHTETKKHLERNPLRGNVLTSYWNISGSVSSSTSFTCYLLYSITLSLSLSLLLSLSLSHSITLSLCLHLTLTMLLFPASCQLKIRI